MTRLRTSTLVIGDIVAMPCGARGIAAPRHAPASTTETTRCR